MSKLITSTEVAERVGYSVKHFQNSWRSIKGLPAPVRLQLASGGLSNPKWREDEIDAFVRKSVTSAPAERQNYAIAG